MLMDMAEKLWSQPALDWQPASSDLLHGAWYISHASRAILTTAVVCGLTDVEASESRFRETVTSERIPESWKWIE